MLTELLCSIATQETLALGEAEVDLRPDLYEPGLVAAESFRRSLLVPAENGLIPAEQVVDAIVLFQREAGSLLEAESGSGQIGLGGFDQISSEALLAAIEGTRQEIDAESVFGPFEANWYGIWDGRDVDHRWSPVSESSQIVGNGVTEFVIRNRQSAWIGDGFGWNVVAEVEGGRVVLGSVYHVENGDPSKIRSHRPHVGIALGVGRLIWITGGEVFFEAIESQAPERYAITGFFYERDPLGEIVIEEPAFQAIYSRSPENRVQFFRFEVAGENSRLVEDSGEDFSEFRDRCGVSLH